MKSSIRNAVNSCVAVMVVVGAVFFSGDAGAAKIEIDHEIKSMPLGRQVELFEDKSGKLTIGEVLGGDISAKFKPSISDNPSFGYTNSAYWVRFAVNNWTGEQIDWYLEVAYPHLDLIELYVMDGKVKVLDKRTAGDGFPFSMREINHRNFVFRLKEPARGGHEYLMRIKSTGAMNLHLVMWSPDEFNDWKSIVQIALGMFYGAILVMIIYNLFLFFSIRDTSYLYYVLYYSFYFIFQMSLVGLAFQYLWPEQVWWHNNNLPVLICGTLFFAILFSRKFLDTHRHLPLVDRFLKIIMVAALVILPFSFFGNYQVMLTALMLLSVVSAMILFPVSIRIYVSGYLPARFYVIAWTAFWIGTIVYSLKMFSLIPDMFATRWVQQATSMMEVVLISLGLADRINYMKKELEDLNVNLESIVEARTMDLDEALKEKEKKDREIQIEYELTGNLQKGFLPPVPYYFEGIKVDAFYRSMGKVGGDFYDIFHMKGGYIGILVADASGHGMPAAFLTALAKISFDEAIQGYLFPADILRQVNNELITAIKTDDFVTAFFVVISPAFEVFYGNASHQKAIVLRSDGRAIEEWDTNGLFLGALEEANDMYAEGQDVLHYGDRLVMYSDGMIDAKNGSNESFGEARFKNLIKDTADLPLQEAKDRIIAEWDSFTGQMPQTDDATMVIIEIDPAYSRLFEYRDRGFKLLSEKKFDEAIVELKQALEINGMDEKTHLYLGECYLKN